ncbi:hypothetical protein D0866_02001 [Hortaea werneckii]|uniref:Uncharacterized protein n=1 Tax=Hortaea werneckii TaxID=91943 RepID=A0A3M7BHR2_HORWE|nr:hypothetical protein D0866_02001 [Hortaea werneckii]
MNRPRNRQPRSDRGGRGGGRGSGGRGRGNGPAGPPRTPKPDYDPNVPTIRQVVPGASVSIVLKADQPTGREVQGRVGELLTRGNHPRGIKVRLQDGRVGRVQRMMDSGAPSSGGSAPLQTPSRIIRMERDVRLDEDEFLRVHLRGTWVLSFPIARAKERMKTSVPRVPVQADLPLPM